MPVHDWSRVEAGIFHDFHHSWTEEIKRALNEGVLPSDYYALAEQIAGGLGPDVLTVGLRGGQHDAEGGSAHGGNGPALQLAPPRTRLTAEVGSDFPRRRTAIAIRHVSGDEVVAMIEVVSPGNKAGRHAMRSFVEKACELLSKQVHLLILDLHPPGPRDPAGIHGAVWSELTDQDYALPADKPLTLAAYDAGHGLRAYVEHVGVGDALPEMPLFLRPGGCVHVPLEATYLAAFRHLPRPWRGVLEA